MKRNRHWIAFFVLAALLLLFLGVNVCAGSVGIPLSEVIKILGGGEADQVSVDIVMQIRLPRALAAAILGGGLALSGYLLQTFFHTLDIMQDKPFHITNIIFHVILIASASRFRH